MSMLLYADDILLVAPPVTSLQRIVSICEAELESLDMRVNPKNPHVFASVPVLA